MLYPRAKLLFFCVKGCNVGPKPMYKKRETLHSGRTTFEVPKRKIRTVFVVGVLPKKKIRHATLASHTSCKHPSRSSAAILLGITIEMIP